jgi:DNA-binding XRE family transcriptional regulator
MRSGLAHCDGASSGFRLSPLLRLEPRRWALARARFLTPLLFRTLDREMPDEEIARLLAELRVWCDEKRGRQAQIAKMLGLPRQSINDWFAGKSVPTLQAGLKIQAFLRQERRRRK